MERDEERKQSPIEHLAAFIVDKRKAFYLLYIGLAIFCVFASGWVQVNDALTDYLPEETETRRGLTVMDEEFTTFGTNRIMVDNIPFAQAEELSEQLAAVLADLTPREEQVLRKRFGIAEKSDHTLEEVGKLFNVTRERIRQIEAKALRKLRHPVRSQPLRSYYEN